LYWSGGDAVPENHYIQLHWATSTANPTYYKFDGDITQTSGSEAIRSLATSTLYKFKLKVFDDGGAELTPREPSETVSCKTGETIISEVPSNLKVWSVDSSTLYVNWKDNAVTPHNFTIQRIKLTPDNPESFEVISSDGVTSYLDLGWINRTNTSNVIGGKVQKGPYYHVIERTTSTALFSDIGSDPSFTSSAVGFPEDKDYNETRINYQKYDNFNIEEATTYQYRVKGCSYIKTDFTRDDINKPEEICSDYSLVKSGTTAPKAPTNLTVTDITSNSVTINWNDESQGENGYLITISTSPTSGFSTGEKVAANTTRFVQTGLSPDTTYYFKVGAYVNSPSGKVYSKFAPINGRTLILLITPTNLRMVTSTVSSITIAWDDQPYEDGYYISTYTPDFFKSKDVAADTESFVQTGLSPDTKYLFGVYAYINSFSGNNFSDTAYEYFRTLDDGGAVPPPLPPSTYTITATAGANGSISPSSVSKTAGQSQTFTATPSTDYVVDEWKLDGGVVPNNDTIYYTLINIQSSHYIQVTFKVIPPPPPPSAPTSFSAVWACHPVCVPTPHGYECYDFCGVQLSWVDVDDETGYEVQRGDGGFLSSPPQNAEGVFDDNVDSVTTYYYQIKACDNVSCSDWSSASITTP